MSAGDSSRERELAEMPFLAVKLIMQGFRMLDLLLDRPGWAVLVAGLAVGLICLNAWCVARLPRVGGARLSRVGSAVAVLVYLALGGAVYYANVWLAEWIPFERRAPRHPATLSLAAILLWLVLPPLLYLYSHSDGKGD